MLMRSTGLGKTELKGKIVGLIRQQEYLVLQVETIEPVKWKIRAAFSMPDLWSVTKFVLRWSKLKMMFSRRWVREAQHPSEF